MMYWQLRNVIYNEKTTIPIFRVTVPAKEWESVLATTKLLRDDHNKILNSINEIKIFICENIQNVTKAVEVPSIAIIPAKTAEDLDELLSREDIVS